jgi:hypothetical protein
MIKIKEIAKIHNQKENVFKLNEKWAKYEYMM